MSQTQHETHDNPAWWEGREFEHKAEAHALTQLLNLVTRRKSIVDIGGGFGRLTPVYAPYFSKLLLLDPSEKLLFFAQDYLKNVRGIEFKKGKAEKLPVASNTYDVALLVRVFDQFEDQKEVIREVSRILNEEGFIILQVENGFDFLKSIKGIAKRGKGISPSDQGGILDILKRQRFSILEILSVSNLDFFLLRNLPLSTRLALEEKLQKLLASIWFGKSIFILAQKRSEEAEKIVSENIIKPLRL